MRTVQNMDLTTTVKKDTLLEALRKNREQHSRIVAEARKGYIEKAKQAILAKLDELQSGKVAALSFGLVPPADHTEAYDTTIQMLEWHTGQEVTLSATEFRNFVMDEWDWAQHFLHSNSMYSQTAASEYKSKYRE
jgi:hypothetical protein